MAGEVAATKGFLTKAWGVAKTGIVLGAIFVATGVMISGPETLQAVASTGDVLGAKHVGLMIGEGGYDALDTISWACDGIKEKLASVVLQPSGLNVA